MNSSVNNIRRIGSVLLAVIALAALLPATSLAQSIDPTDEQYTPVQREVRGGDPSGGSISELPFTGLDVAAIAAIGIGLVGAGFVVRRAARGGSDPA